MSSRNNASGDMQMLSCCVYTKMQILMARLFNKPKSIRHKFFSNLISVWVRYCIIRRESDFRVLKIMKRCLPLAGVSLYVRRQCRTTSLTNSGVCLG